jgi:hypothetical protein
VGRVALVSLVNSHIDARGGAGTAAVRLENVSAFMLSSNLLIASTGSAFILNLVGSYDGTVVGNTFFGPPLVGVNAIGVSTNSAFVGNHFHQTADPGVVAFQFGTATQYNIATNNVREVPAPLRNVDGSTANGGESNNQVGQPLNISSVVTTTGGTSLQTFSVDISKAALGRKCPSIAVSLNVIALNIGVLYDWADPLNSSTVARITLYTLDGTNLPAATSYRLGLSVNPGTY